MIDSDKLTYLLSKLVPLDEDGFSRFMDCLKDASGHTGHSELYERLKSDDKH